MSKTYSYPDSDLRAASSLTGVVVDVFNEDLLSRQVTERTPNGGIETVYRFAKADVEHPTTIRVGVYPPAGKGKTFSVSGKLTTWKKAVNGDNTEEWSPKIYTIAISDGDGTAQGEANYDVMFLLALTRFLTGTVLESGVFSADRVRLMKNQLSEIA